MVRGNESESEKISSLASVLEDEQAAVIRNVALEASEFMTSEEMVWFMEQSGLQGKERMAVLKKALADFRDATRAAMQMVQSADAMNSYSAGFPNRIPGRVAHG
jgi:hypothetical protein